MPLHGANNGGDQKADRDLIYFYRRSVELVLQSVVHLYRPYCAHESTNLFEKDESHAYCLL